MSMRGVYDICTTLGYTPSGGWHAGNFYNGMIKVSGENTPDPVMARYMRCGG